MIINADKRRAGDDKRQHRNKNWMDDIDKGRINSADIGQQTFFLIDIEKEIEKNTYSQQRSRYRVIDRGIQSLHFQQIDLQQRRQDKKQDKQQQAALSKVFQLSFQKILMFPVSHSDRIERKTGKKPVAGDRSLKFDIEQ